MSQRKCSRLPPEKGVMHAREKHDNPVSFLSNLLILFASNIEHENQTCTPELAPQ